MSHYLGLVMEWAPGGNLTNLVSRCVQNEDAECARGLRVRAARMGYVPPLYFLPLPSTPPSGSQHPSSPPPW